MGWDTVEQRIRRCGFDCVFTRALAPELSAASRVNPVVEDIFSG